MVRNVALTVAYDGTLFFGWQSQPALRTVQGVLEQAIRRVVRHQLGLLGSGRTDTGVHAAGHVSSFHTTCELPVDRFRHSIGGRLPKDLSVVALREVHPGFHATRSAVSKLYRYRIHNARNRPVEHQRQRQTYHFWQPLDVDRMRTAARHFVGVCDFTSFASKGAERESMVREVLRCDVDRHLDEIRIDVEGNGFLYRQVRNMVGTLVNVGRGSWDPNCIPDILAARDRARAGPAVPARGLCLRWVRYPAHLMQPDPAPPAPHDSGRTEAPGHPCPQSECP